MPKHISLFSTNNSLNGISRNLGGKTDMNAIARCISDNGESSLLNSQIVNQLNLTIAELTSANIKALQDITAAALLNSQFSANLASATNSLAIANNTLAASNSQLVSSNIQSSLDLVNFRYRRNLDFSVIADNTSQSNNELPRPKNSTNDIEEPSQNNNNDSLVPVNSTKDEDIEEPLQNDNNDSLVPEDSTKDIIQPLQSDNNDLLAPVNFTQDIIQPLQNETNDLLDFINFTNDIIEPLQNETNDLLACINFTNDAVEPLQNENSDLVAPENFTNDAVEPLQNENSNLVAPENSTNDAVEPLQNENSNLVAPENSTNDAIEPLQNENNDYFKVLNATYIQSLEYLAVNKFVFNNESILLEKAKSNAALAESLAFELADSVALISETELNAKDASIIAKIESNGAEEFARVKANHAEIASAAATEAISKLNIAKSRSIDAIGAINKAKTNLALVEQENNSLANQFIVTNTALTSASENNYSFPNEVLSELSTYYAKSSEELELYNSVLLEANQVLSSIYDKISEAEDYVSSKLTDKCEAQIVASKAQAARDIALLKADGAAQLVIDISKDKTIAIKLASQAETDLAMANEKLSKAIESFNASEKNLTFAQNISAGLFDNISSENTKTLMGPFSSKSI